MDICTIIENLFAIPQFFVDSFFGNFGAVPPDLSAPLDAILGCIRHH